MANEDHSALPMPPDTAHRSGPVLLLLGLLAALALAGLVATLLSGYRPGRPDPQPAPAPLAEDRRPEAGAAAPPALEVAAASAASAASAAPALQTRKTAEAVGASRPRPRLGARPPIAGTDRFKGSFSLPRDPSRAFTAGSQLPLDLAARAERLREAMRALEAQKTAAAPPNDRPADPPQAALWNYWLDAEGGKLIVPVPEKGPLVLGQRQRLQFRLSTLNLAAAFDRVGEFKASAELQNAVAAGVDDDTRSSLELQVLVHAVDGRRVRIDSDAQQLRMRIDLEALRGQLRDPRGRPELGQEGVGAVLARARVAEFGFDFAVLTPGTHDIGIAIVDAASGYPLQTMVARVTGDAEWPRSVSVESTGQTLLSSRSAPSDLTLLLTELSSTVGVETTTFLHAELGVQDANGRYDHIHWQTDISLPGLVGEVQSISDTPGVLADNTNIRDAGRSLGRRLFDPQPDKSQTAPSGADINLSNAQAARRLLFQTALAKGAKLPPSLLVTIRSKLLVPGAKYASMVLPLGALAVEDPDSAAPERPAIFLGERYALALSLPDQRVLAGAPCPASWYVALPDDSLKGDGALTAALAGLKPVAREWLLSPQVHRQTAGLETLRAWMNPGRATATAPPPPQEPVVFTFIGHHDKGRLYLSATGRALRPGDLQRDFQSSSIAFLNACNSALGEVNDGTPVGRLAQLGVAATVATTSTISGEIAAAYMDCLSAVLAAADPLTIGQAHALTTQCLVAGKPAPLSGKPYRYGAAALKYLLIGNPHQRICAPARKATT